MTHGPSYLQMGLYPNSCVCYDVICYLCARVPTVVQVQVLAFFCLVVCALINCVLTCMSMHTHVEKYTRA